MVRHTAEAMSHSAGNVVSVGYREYAPPTVLRDLVESAWALDGPPAPVRVLPDGCMDLIAMNGDIVVAGPDTAAVMTSRDGDPYVGLRFRPGILPRLLGVPAGEIRDRRVLLSDLRRPPPRARSLTELTEQLAAEEPRSETAPWTMPQLRQVTEDLAAGSNVADLAHALGWSPRTLQRQCTAVYGYGAATLRRILRFRRARRLLDAGLVLTDVAVRAGYSDQPHLHREVRALAGVPLRWFGQDGNGANRSTQLPSGSATVA
ncbi:helix-turn-helix domain-containing protein [Mycobacterium neglectum]|uniref:helix-turn-helix domain-containing protein n=1 Tax=Mycobacterium neglectum TaxID=242737 RepID=UPI001FE8B07B|nr:AraC family transcriptional regulator [Mycobacterium neglectum]